MLVTSWIPCLADFSLIITRLASRRCLIFTGSRSSSILPDSTLARSRMSLIKLRRWLPLSYMAAAYPFSSSSRLLISSSWRTWEKPIMAFRGVRSSWDMLARNSDFAWLADSASFTASSSWFVLSLTFPSSSLPHSCSSSLDFFSDTIIWLKEWASTPISLEDLTSTVVDRSPWATFSEALASWPIGFAICLDISQPIGTTRRTAVIITNIIVVLNCPTSVYISTIGLWITTPHPSSLIGTYDPKTWRPNSSV